MRSFAGIQGVRTLKELKGQDVFGWRVTYNEPSRHTTSATRTFGQSIQSLSELQGAVASFGVRASYRLRRQGRLARAVQVFLSTGKHAVQPVWAAKAQLLPYPTADSGLIVETALAALQRAYSDRHSYKRAGIVLFDLVERSEQQLPLLEPLTTGALERRERLMTAFDEIRDRFGPPSLSYAVQLGHTKWLPRREHRSPSYTTDWHQIPLVKV